MCNASLDILENVVGCGGGRAWCVRGCVQCCGVCVDVLVARIHVGTTYVGVVWVCCRIVGVLVCCM